jgi:O-antigen ligase
LINNSLDYSVIFFVGVVLLSVAASFMVRTPLRLFLDAVATPCGFYFIAKKQASRSDFLPKLFIGAVLALLALGALGVYEGFSGHDLLKWDGDQDHPEDSDDFRVNGPWAAAENYGLVMVMLLLFVRRLRSFHRSGLVGRKYLLLATILAVAAVAYTLTRGIWLSLLAGSLIYYLRRRPVLALTTTVAAVALWLMLQQSVLPQVFGSLWENRIAKTKTVYARIATYKSALAMFEDHPVLGVGFGTYTEMWERFPAKYFFQYQGEDSVGAPHNLFLAILAEMGLLGAVAFLVFQVHIFRALARLAATARNRAHSDYAEVSLAIGVAFLVVGIGLNFTYDTTFTSKLYFLFLGTLSGLVDLARGSYGATVLPRAVPSVATFQRGLTAE